jgi:hypothetical protein
MSGANGPVFSTSGSRGPYFPRGCKDGILTRPHLVMYSPIAITSNTVTSTDKLLSVYLSLTYILIPFTLTPRLLPHCISLSLLVAWSLAAWNLHRGPVCLRDCSQCSVEQTTGFQG